MIKLKSKFDYKTNFCDIDYKIEHTNSIEHLQVIIFLMERLLDADESFTVDNLTKLLKDTLKQIRKEEGKR